jgi:F1F0 ATPase subunit 2
MSETLILALSFLGGAALGAIFFGGLWWTIRRGLQSQRPVAWFACSLLLRSAIALAGLFFISRGDWRRLVACLAGFLASRVLVMLLTRIPPNRQISATEGRGL